MVQSVLSSLTFSVLLVIAVPAMSAETPLKLPAMFGNNMVLQRDRAVPVWGWTQPGGEVTVEFASQKKTGKADAEGKWTVKLDPLTASVKPREMQITQGTEALVFTDILVGDVWLCSGQSNMFFRMNKVENSQQEIAAANQPQIRFFVAKEKFAQNPASDVDGAWKPVSPTTAAECSAVAFYFATALHQKLGVPMGLLVSAVGGTRIETWMQAATLTNLGEAGPSIEKWKDVSPTDFEKIATDYRSYQYRRDKPRQPTDEDSNKQNKLKPPLLRCHDCPGALHNGMIAPLQPFSIRGAIWYQGEANSGRSGPYEKLLPALISDWRQAWGENLPFLFVQLAPFQGTHPAFREAQLRIWQTTPRTAMVVTTDVGDAKDIHPTRKRPVGERLALAARALSYDEKLEYSGPVFKSMRVERDRTVVSFTHVGSGLMAKGDALEGITLAGADGKFHPARAVIEGSTVVVTSSKVANPAAVRYGWAMVPDGNLCNREGLPAAPFRSDPPAAPRHAVDSE